MLKGIIYVVIVAVVANLSVTTMEWLGYFQRVYNHAPGHCRKLPGIENGSEDIQTLPNGLAFISSGLKLRDSDVYNSRPGLIYTFDFNKPDEPPRALTIKADKDFKLDSPHGISIWNDPVTDDVYLFVISHRPNEIIDKFHFDPATHSLTHLRRIAGDPNFHKLNDLVVVGDDQFFFTNYYYAIDWLEWTIGLRWASLGYFDGTGSRLIETKLSIANGIALSPDRKYVYMAHCGDAEIRVYKMYKNHTLSFQHSINVNTKVDNVDVDAATGDIWLGAHPVTYKTLAYQDNPAALAPSQILRVKMSGAKATSVEEIYSNDGSFLSAASIGVVHGKGLLVGTIAGQAMYCQLE